jgi:hypothetical protein
MGKNLKHDEVIDEVLVNFSLSHFKINILALVQKEEQKMLRSNRDK